MQPRKRKSFFHHLQTRGMPAKRQCVTEPWERLQDVFVQTLTSKSRSGSAGDPMADLVISCQVPETSKSTISMAFSPNGDYVASSHGDHTVKIICCATGKVLKTLVGHARTPWTVKFHPTLNHILASGCLAGEVKIWDLTRDDCLLMSLSFPPPVVLSAKNSGPASTTASPVRPAARSRATMHGALSVCFHNSGDSVAVACGPDIYTWNYAAGKDPEVIFTSENQRSIDLVSFPFGDTQRQWMLVGYNSLKSRGPSLSLYDLDDITSLSRKGGLLEPSANLKPKCDYHSFPFLDPILFIPHAVYHSEHGVAISRTGRELAFCYQPPAREQRPTAYRLFEDDDDDQGSSRPEEPVLAAPPEIRVISLRDESKVAPLGSLVASIDIPDMSDFTTLSFSPCGHYLLVGSSNMSLSTLPLATRALPTAFLARVSVDSVGLSRFSHLRSSGEVIWDHLSDENLNVVAFHPNEGRGFALGTDRGAVKLFTPLKIAAPPH